MKFDSSRPIYRQIIDSYKKQLIRGELKTGDKIPSQREYAEQVRINPNTVQRAYREMEALQMVETQRGQGTFIIVAEPMLTEIKLEMARDVLEYFSGEMKSLGYTYAQMISMLEEEEKKQGGGF
ncbi:MAG: GntR family transcriptional regulator [Syntrophomonas sp.]|uniref:GntR family transcriptional regulator n=1 Tax=Syntrophomonas sp. TaxID=2053627 RepID=UPI002612916A|nr:GntR family transcriptional regulator [Syntrophomonas sp.]MDD2510192.1 GntR family transcriptional regulator [Syntrophomonas sp.]MDD3880020.1 GntR family transcriptional regulator [Syntrophomonas sp.]MDD4625799.1 GntR family transcriptional regulator [Syntrophomonas sp.]